MFIINLIKKLMGQAQEKVASSTSSMASAFDKASRKLDDNVTQDHAEATEDQVARETAREAKEQPQTHWQARVTIGDKTYKTERNDDVPALYESIDGGKHWSYVNALPLEYVSGLTVVGGKQLVIGGQFLEKSAWKVLKEELQASGAYITKGDEGYDKVRELQELKNDWEISERAFAIGKRGVVKVDPMKDSCEPRFHLPHIDNDMVVGSPSFTNNMKSVLKAAGQKDADKVKIYLRKYIARPELFFSLNGEEWHWFEGDLPKDFKDFEHYNGITVATTNSGKRYFYCNSEWHPLDFEADLEFEKSDAPKIYKRLNVPEMRYSYLDDNYDRNDVGTSKMVHILIKDGKKGLINGCSPEVYYLESDHVRWLSDDIIGYEISKVENVHGEVIITSHDKKNTYHQIFYEESWTLCGGDHTTQSDLEDQSLAGPFCFESVILDDDPLWDKVNSPVKEYPLDVKHKEVAKTKKIIIKVPRNGGTGEAFFYLDKEGRWTLFAAEAGGNPFWALFSTGRPSPNVDKKGNIVSYNLEPLIYYAANSSTFFRWTRKKKGFIKKEIVYEWEKVNPTDLKMMGKVYAKG